MASGSCLGFEFAAKTDIGCRRGNNEDSFGYDCEQKIFVVCDGMGGNAAGEVASSLAVRTLIESFAATQGADGAEPEPSENRLVNAIYEANRAVWDSGNSDPKLNSMGTTLVCVCMDGDRAVIGNVGDSRAYHVRNGTCSQITMDHSYIEEQIRSGIITREMAANSKLQSVITRAIGVAEMVEPDLFAARVQAGDMILLTTDGLTRYASPEVIAESIATGPDLDATCGTLIEHAKHGGGADNITCILLRVTGESNSTPADAIEAEIPAI